MHYCLEELSCRTESEGAINGFNFVLSVLVHIRDKNIVNKLMTETHLPHPASFRCACSLSQHHLSTKARECGDFCSEPDYFKRYFLEI